MPRDQLGADPYQRAALQIAKAGIATMILLVVGGLASFGYGFGHLDQAMFIGIGAACIGAAGLVGLYVSKKLKSESLGWGDILSG